MEASDKAQHAARMLAWYDRHRRALPWRAAPGDQVDPYHVWLSEIMLQQTTVAAATPYYLRFLETWPTVADLAAAPLDAVLTAWAGLGYYARARNLHKCAIAVTEEHGGRFPDSEDALRALPGIGAYTAAAIAALAFGRAAVVVDGNVERVVARLFAVETPLPKAKPALRELAGTLTPATRAGDYAQAMMDLGATICVPARPRCLSCPVAAGCDGRALGVAAALPRKAPKADRPLRRALVYWCLDGSGAVLLRRRPEQGLLGGMMELPSTPWSTEPWPEPGEAAPLQAAWRVLPGQVRHVFTHFALELRVCVGGRGDAAVADRLGGRFVAIERLGDYALPSVMKKVVRHALRHA